MVADGKQIPLHSADDSFRLDKLVIGKSEKIFSDNIKEILRDAKEYSSRRYSIIKSCVPIH